MQMASCPDEPEVRSLAAAVFGGDGDGRPDSAAEALLNELEPLGGCAVSAVLRAAVRALSDGRWRRCDAAARNLVDLAGQKLYETHWSAVPIVWRKAHRLFSALQAVAMVAADRAAASEALAVADKGLLLGAPTQGVDLNALASTLQRLVPDPAPDGSGGGGARSGLPATTSAAGEPERARARKRRRLLRAPAGPSAAVPRVRCPSVVAFAERCARTPGEPVVITHAIDHWPALSKWPDRGYLLSVAGKRLVPVETGGRYTADEWRQELMTLGDLLSRFGPPRDAGGGNASGSTDNSLNGDSDGNANAEADVYMAQHDLFEQIPELAADISTPDYCCVVGSGGAPVVNAWLGPAGTVSPLHHDPYHNLLCQVVGRKRVLLFSPADSAKLYAHPGALLHNTSQVDALDPDLEAYPLFAEAERFECELGPGDALYIPPRWWHHVTSLSESFSVSHWFGQ